MELPAKELSILSDDRIIDLYWRRDQQAVSATDAKYGKYLLSIAYNIVHDSCDSEECLNDTYLSAWNAIPPAKPDSLQAFLATIMRRRAIDCYKARKRGKRVASQLTVSLSELEEILSADDDTYSQAAAEELGRIISKFVRALPDRRMYIFMSRYYAARPVKVIAKMLRCSESTVHKELASIKRDLKKTLEKEGYFT